VSGPGAVTLVIDLEAIEHNTRVIAGLLPGTAVVGVTKMTCGDGNVADAMLHGGVSALGDSRHVNLWNLRRVGIRAPLWLLRSAEPELALETVRAADISLNCELQTIRALDRAAERLGEIHGIVVMVDVGDLREGVLPEELIPLLKKVRELRHVRVEGLGTNLTCWGFVVPTEDNLGELLGLARDAEEIIGHRLLVSGGNSSTLPLAFRNGMPSGVDNLRIGESILLGNNVLTSEPLLGSLRLDAFVVHAPVVECRVKPSVPRGVLNPLNTFGTTPVFPDRGRRRRAICALGRQDALPEGLRPLDPRIEVLGASSDHLILDVEDLDTPPRLGEPIAFIPGYAASLQLFTSPYVHKVVKPRGRPAKE
jgi:ornithine racemase